MIMCASHGCLELIRYPGPVTPGEAVLLCPSEVSSTIKAWGPLDYVIGTNWSSVMCNVLC